MLYRALALSLLVILSSCAKEDEAPSSPAGAFTIPVETLEEGQKVAMDAKLECGSNCSPSVGLLAFATPKQAGQCSAFLVSPDTVATNSHCIPSDLKEPGTSCKNRIWMHFAENGKNETRIACDKVIYDSKSNKGSPDKPDYAYVKLATASARPTLRISRLGFPEGSRMQIQKVNPVHGAGRMQGKQEIVTCRTVQNSDTLDSFFHDLAPVALVAECKIIRGNSGSPVLAADGTVRGVVFAYRDLDEVKEIITKNQSLKLLEDLQNLNFVANFACLHDIDGSEGRLVPACATHPTELRKHLANKGAEEGKRIDSELQRQLKALTSDFQWEPRYEVAGLQVSMAYAGVKIRPAPKCVNAATAASYTDGKEQPLPHWLVMESFDRYLRSRAELSAASPVPTKIQLFSPEAGEYTAVISGEGFVYKVENLKACP